MITGEWSQKRQAVELSLIRCWEADRSDQPRMWMPYKLPSTESFLQSAYLEVDDRSKLCCRRHGGSSRHGFMDMDMDMDIAWHPR